MTLPLIQIQSVRKRYGAETVLKNIDLDIFDGEFLTLLGPSGCGKTTLLRMISGFEQPDSGDILMQGSSLLTLPPQARNVHTVFQSYALFPHLDVFENVAFALRIQKHKTSVIHERVQQALTMVRLENFAKRAIRELSGGQQQRVAIARAIINRPKVLLLDEPLSSLDYRLRKAMQAELKELQKKLNMTFVFVTHDQEEALSMSDRIVVLNHGEVAQSGSPRSVYETPANLYVAKFIGETNIFDIYVKNIEEAFFETEVESVAFRCKMNPHVQTVGQALHLLIRPEDIRVWSRHEVTDTSHMIPGEIVEIIYKGSTVDVVVRLPSGKLINCSEFFDEDDDKLEYSIAESVWVQWPEGWEVIIPHES